MNREELIEKMEEYLKNLKEIADQPKMPNNALEFDRWERFDRFLKAVKNKTGLTGKLSVSELQVKFFMLKSNTELKTLFLKNDKYFPDDKNKRDIWQCVLLRNEKSYSFTFGQSSSKSDYGKTPPTAYEIFSCLTKYNPENFENFCLEYGYDNDSRKAEKIYIAVQEEYNNVISLFSEDEIINELREIN